MSIAPTCNPTGSQSAAKQGGAQRSNALTISKVFSISLLYLCTLGFISADLYGFQSPGLSPTLKPKKQALDYALQSALIPGQGQIDLGQDLLGWGIRVAEVGLIGTAYVFYNVRNSNYALADAATNQADQTLYYNNAVTAHWINNGALLLALGVYVFNVVEAYWAADQRYGYSAAPPGAITVVSWRF